VPCGVKVIIGVWAGLADIEVGCSGWCVESAESEALVLVGWASVEVVGMFLGQVVEVAGILELYWRMFFFRGHLSLKA